MQLTDENVNQDKQDQAATEQYWKEVIIDHSQFPRHHGRLENASHEGRGENPFCGDRVRLQLLIDTDNIISDIRFEATGCAISLSSASLLAASLTGKSRDEALGLFSSVHALLAGQPETGQTGLGELEALALIRRYPARLKCASLAWHVFNNVMHGEKNVTSTEQA